MAHLVNNTAHLIIIAGKMYIPRKPVSVADLDKLKSKYPEVSAMIKAGQLITADVEEAEVIEHACGAVPGRGLAEDERGIRGIVCGAQGELGTGGALA